MVSACIVFLKWLHLMFDSSVGEFLDHSHAVACRCFYKRMCSIWRCVSQSFYQCTAIVLLEGAFFLFSTYMTDMTRHSVVQDSVKEQLDFWRTHCSCFTCVTIKGRPGKVCFGTVTASIITRDGRMFITQNATPHILEVQSQWRPAE